MILIAAYQYRNTDHDVDGWIDAVTTAAWSKSKTALDFGSEYHHMAFMFNTDQQYTPPEELEVFRPGYCKWLNENVL